VSARTETELVQTELRLRSGKLHTALLEQQHIASERRAEAIQLRLALEAAQKASGPAQAELARSRALLAQSAVADDPDTIVNYACLTFKEGKFEEARAKFAEALGLTGYAADLAYNVALSVQRRRRRRRRR
jgi:tetratricopeptide (TPR) repeat protein